MSFPTGATAILLLVCILSLLSTKCPAQKHCAGQQDIKSERYSFVCVLRVDRLPGLDNPMQSLRRRARFPAASTPAGGPCRFSLSKDLPLPVYPYGSQPKGMGGEHHIFKDAASVLHKGACGAICQNQNHDRRAIIGVCVAPHHFCV